MPATTPPLPSVTARETVAAFIGLENVAVGVVPTGTLLAPGDGDWPVTVGATAELGPKVTSTQ